jgi:DNA-binding winged helix-turn-helix (wHTH) protein/Flp pilus assembly protein TadD
MSMSSYEFGSFRLDGDGLVLFHRGEPVPLGPKVVETLLALIERPGEVLAKSTLLERIWPEGYVEEANLAQNIYVLRKLLRTLASLDVIETLPRRGYRFTAPVHAISRVPSALAPAAVVPAAAARPRWQPLAAGVAFAALCVVMAVSFVLAHRAPNAGLSANGARLYEIGRYYWNLRSRPDVERSLIYFAQVIRTDPNDARGFAALADANATMGSYRYGPSSQRVYFTRARDYAQRALELDPNSAQAYAALGFIGMQGRNSSAAIAELRRAIALDPSYGPAHEWYGIALIGTGRLPEAFEQLQTAADLDPLSVSTSAWLGSAAYLDRHFNEAIAYSSEALDLAPQRTDVLTTIGEAYEAEGNVDRAVEAFKRYKASCADCRAEGAALLAHAYALEHHVPQARLQLAFAMVHAQDVDPADLAAAAAAVGDRSIAFALIRRVHSHLEWTAIENDPRFDALRADAHFRALTQTPA